ncbi:uncharacterized protein L3040_001440 [Drepanopeziza brunnea f. sp. 'multigermtubi']|uniref:uncharacterized protein n=1 Tax=Drepanopeziza brunnea f. sp. 'multigermtubi' TaxID=698441 RepID=UPI002388AECE|nr:hypothetical protein L3040_001440 [Drepanopeziza brunnea f. sp. 'multigermtubi']
MAPASGRNKSRIKSEYPTSSGLKTPTNQSKSRTLSPLLRDEIDLTTSSDELEDVPSTSSFQTSQAEQIDYDDASNTIKVQEFRPRSAAVPNPTSRASSTPTPASRVPSRPIRQQAAAKSPPIMSGLEVIGKNVKTLVDTIEDLKRIGLKSIDAKLPELILVGDQSAGKSSLMGAIAEINLPKGQSMCTKCPTNIKTTCAEDWSCRVSLHNSYDHVPHKYTAKNDQFPDWVENEQLVIEPFAELDKNEKSKLEEVLRCAQVAILNPSKAPAVFLPGIFDPANRDSDEDEAMFSPNVISVEISGPGLPELSFYDLPGLFNAANARKQRGLVEVFDNMTEKYIKHENGLIICTMSMHIDPGNSKTKGFIERYADTDERCIGVLTMPDRMQDGKAHSDYTSIFEKSKYVLSPHGYFVTKQPGPDFEASGDKYHSTAREEEDRYFETAPLWKSGGEWHRYRNRCGTKTIQEYLSKAFAQQILKSLPNITDNIRQQTSDVDRDLSQLPDVANHQAQSIVRQSLSDFSYQVRQLLEPNSVYRKNAFQKEWKKLCGQFVKAIEFMCPRCCIKADEPEVINLDDTDDEEDLVQQHPKRPLGLERAESPLSKNPRNGNATAQLRTTEPSTPVRGVKKELRSGRKIAKLPTLHPSIQKLPDDAYGPFKQRYLAFGYGFMSIMDIRQAIEDNAMAGRPGNVNDVVMEDYVLKAINMWKRPVDTFIDGTFKQLRDEIIGVLARVLIRYKDMSLHRESKAIVEKFLDAKEKEQRARSQNFFEVEKSSLFTVCDAEFERHKAVALDLLSAARKKHRVQNYVDSHTGITINGRVRDETRLRADAEANIGPDAYGKELNTAAYIRGYYDIARIRFTDYLCVDMNVTYFHKIKDEIPSLLEECLQINGANSDRRCQELLEESDQIAAQRSALVKRKEQLSTFSKILDKLQVEINNKSGPSEDRMRELDAQIARHATAFASASSFALDGQQTIPSNDDNDEATAESSTIARSPLKQAAADKLRYDPGNA